MFRRPTRSTLTDTPSPSTTPFRSRPGCQFSCACDGSMRRPPVPALWRRSAEIARAALTGHVAASVGMATHYHANYVLPRWAPKLTKIEQIGAHIFYRWPGSWRSEEHTSELQSLMRISYAVFCLKKKNTYE